MQNLLYNEFMDFRDQLKRLRESSELTQSELARKIDCSKQIVSAWESGIRSPSSVQRKKLCELFRISEAELFGASAIKESTPTQKIPIISWVHANKFEEIQDPFPAGISDEYTYTEEKGKNIFALRVQNDCMSPEFNEGDIIIVRPNIDIANGDFVIIADRDDNTATFKQYKEYGSKRILHPLNPKYKDIELDHKKRYVIVGKIIGKTKKY